MAKPQYASLTAGLLARKGEAHPAAVDLANHGVNRDSDEELESQETETQQRKQEKPKLTTVEARRLPQLMDPIWEKKHQESQRAKTTEEPFPESLHELEDADVRKRVEMIREELNRSSLSAANVETTPQAKTAKKSPAKKKSTKAPSAHPQAATLQPVCDGLKKTKNQAQKRTKKIERAAVTMRLDPSRYLAMKLVGAKLSRTNQSILLDALDMYMKSLTDHELSDCNCLKKIIKESFEHA